MSFRNFRPFCSIRLYYFHYRGFKPKNLLAGESVDFAPELLLEAKRLILLKHYSYSTEKTYLRSSIKRVPIGMIIIKFGLKGWMLVKIARCYITGSYLGNLPDKVFEISWMQKFASFIYEV